MEVFKYHIYLCAQPKPEWALSCAGCGAEQTLAELRSQVSKSGLDSEVQITTCGCLGLCEKGPNLVIYPEGVWDCGVTSDKVAELVASHLKAGKPVDGFARTDLAGMKREIIEHLLKVKARKEYMDRSGMLPEGVNNLMRGFMESRIMLSAIELDIFSAIGPGSSAKQVAKRIKADPRGTETILNALAALKLLSKTGDRFHNTPVTARDLVADSPDCGRPAMMHTVHLWHRWSTLTEAVKKGTAVELVEMKKRDPKVTRAFIAAMHKNAWFSAPLVVSAIDLNGVNTLLDLGGGSGAYAIAFARKKPNLKITVFDLPNVIPLTRKYIAQAGLERVIKTQAGDLLKDQPGKGSDLIFASAICHMLSPRENISLFKRVRKSLNAHGRIVIQDFILQRDKISPRFAAVFALNMLVNTKAGGTYSGKEYLDWLEKAGFAQAKIQSLPGPTSLVIAKKK